MTETAKSYSPIYTFSLPSDILNNLRPRELNIPPSHPLHPANNQLITSHSPTPTTTDEPQRTTITNGAFTCALTGASFPDLAGLKDHYKTDWYKYNAKLRQQGKPTGVTEEQFDKLVEGLSLSGSDSSSSASNSDGSDSDSSQTPSDTAVSRLLRKQHLSKASALNAIDDDTDWSSLSGPRSALVWFEAPDIALGTQYGVYRAALPIAGIGRSKASGAEVMDELKGVQIPSSLGKGATAEEERPRQWTLLMFGGGHFAGMVVSLVPRLVSKGKGKEKEREVVILQKKTFHRYTTRRKQGGAQSAHDGGKGKAKSGGAMIRRHNEQALIEEVRETLTSWKQEIDDSEIIFLRASRTNHKTFFAYDESPFDKKDPRIRGFSFPTRRPTISELTRAFTELTRVKTSNLSPAALAELDAAYLASITPVPTPTPAAPKPTTPKPVVIKLTKEEELERDRWSRLIDMVKKGRVEAVTTFLDKYGPELEQARGVKNGVWGTLPDWMEEAKLTPTLLHVASAADQGEMVRWLLVEKRADPTLEASFPPPTSTSTSTSITSSTLSSTQTTATPINHEEGTVGGRPVRTPYEMAGSRETRNVFRFLTTQYPDWWDWTGSGPTGARVPSGLTEEKEEEREQKGRERRNKLREKLNQREKDREAKEAEEKEKLEEEEKERKAEEEKELARLKKSNLASTGPQRLGGGPPRAIVNREMNAAGLTEEQKMRIQREQRARAAEARLGGR